MNRAIKQCVISFNLGDGYQGIQTYLTVIASISIIKCSVTTSTFNDNNIVCVRVQFSGLSGTYIQ